MCFIHALEPIYLVFSQLKFQYIFDLAIRRTVDQYIHRSINILIKQQSSTSSSFCLGSSSTRNPATLSQSVSSIIPAHLAGIRKWWLCCILSTFSRYLSDPYSSSAFKSCLISFSSTKESQMSQPFFTFQLTPFDHLLTSLCLWRAIQLSSSCNYIVFQISHLQIQYFQVFLLGPFREDREYIARGNLDIIFIKKGLQVGNFLTVVMLGEKVPEQPIHSRFVIALFVDLQVRIVGRAYFVHCIKQVLRVRFEYGVGAGCKDLHLFGVAILLADSLFENQLVAIVGVDYLCSCRDYRLKISFIRLMIIYFISFITILSYFHLFIMRIEITICIIFQSSQKPYYQHIYSVILQPSQLTHLASQPVQMLFNNLISLNQSFSIYSIQFNCIDIIVFLSYNNIMQAEKQKVANNMQQFYREVKGKWNSLYPIYFNSLKSISEGRKVSKQLAIPDPTIEQLSHAVGLCRIRNIIQPHKAYSRDFLERGRLKAEVYDKQGKPIHPTIDTKKKFLNAVAVQLKQIRESKKK